MLFFYSRRQIGSSQSPDWEPGLSGCLSVYQVWYIGLSHSLFICKLVFMVSFPVITLKMSVFYYNSQSLLPWNSILPFSKHTLWSAKLWMTSLRVVNIFKSFLETDLEYLISLIWVNTYSCSLHLWALPPTVCSSVL